MSFSIPTTSKPSATKWSTASEPIRPPAPVMIATGIASLLPSPAGVSMFERLRRSAPRRRRSTRGCRPAPARRCAAAATRPGRRASRSRRGRSARPPGASPRPASIGTSLPVSSRQISVVSRSERLHSRPPPTFTVRPSQASGSSSWRSTRSTRSSTWSRSRTCLPCAAEADVGERVAEVVGEHPVGEDPLVDLAHLPGAGDHAAAVDHRGDAEPVAVLLDQQLGGELGRAVEGAGALERELLGDARRARRRGTVLLGGELEAGLRLLQAAAPPAARPGRRGWSRGRRGRRRRGGPARGSCRRR